MLIKESTLRMHHILLMMFDLSREAISGRRVYVSVNRWCYVTMIIGRRKIYEMTKNQIGLINSHSLYYGKDNIGSLIHKLKNRDRKFMQSIENFCGMIQLSKVNYEKLFG